jgi:hypothetical protein
MRVYYACKGMIQIEYSITQKVNTITAWEAFWNGVMHKSAINFVSQIWQANKGKNHEFSALQ